MLGVSLGYSAVYALVDLIGKLTAHKPLSSQTTTLNPSEASGHPWLDLALQLVRIFFGVVPALLALHLLKRGGRAGQMGFQAHRIGFDAGWGAGLALVIGIPGLALYLASRAIGINTTVVPEALPLLWWTVPVLLLSAAQNAFLEEVVVVGYLTTRLTRALLEPPSCGYCQRPPSRRLPPVPGFRGIHWERHHGNGVRTFLYPIPTRGPADHCPCASGLSGFCRLRASSRSPDRSRHFLLKRSQHPLVPFGVVESCLPEAVAL